MITDEYRAVTKFDPVGNAYIIVEAYGHTGRYHVNFSRWNENTQSYEGGRRSASDMTLSEAENYVYDRL